MGSKSEDSSSVMLLTPTTQDVICIDDSTNDFGEIDTMDMLANIQKTESESIENLRQIESKNIVKKQQKELCGEHFFLKPAACIKKEKKSQANLEVQKIEDRLLHRTAFNLNTNKNQSFGITSKNAIEEKIHEQEEQVEDNDDDDAMPKPFVVKQEPKDYSHIPKKLTFKERFNIECDNCEKLYRLLGPNLSDREFELHLNKCSFHNQPDMPQNTPEGFWNPLMLTFDENDPRNEVLIDNRFKDNKHQFKK
uniref:Uncharacterized protein n=2 Tax=Stomoxys calcitrans TaxID=35570 RepID=A0A1I8PAR5_STOCA